jgi:hypothetical protein
MNERVIKLYNQATEFAYKTAGADAGKGTIIESLTAGKFAELIVRECAEYITEYFPHSRYEARQMKKHFGVEE